MSSCLMPKTTVNEIEKLMRRFLWGVVNGRRKFHLVACEAVCWPLELGDLGLKRLREFNIALLCKWFWRLKEDKLWVILLREKYEVQSGGFFIKFKSGSFGCSYPQHLSKIVELFKYMSQLSVGDGKTVSFWNDSWCSKLPLAS